MNRRVLWIIELFLWVIIATIISFSVVFIHSIEEQKKNSYYLFFNDIDGLMKGSPVRLMGMQIGYVQDIKTFDNKVFVSFLVTNKNIKVPEQATATVEFYGLGGSKSLEITPSLHNTKRSQGDDLILTKEPYRIQDFYDVQSSISKTIVSIGNSFAMMLNENEIYQKQSELKVSDKIQKINDGIKNTHDKEMNLMNKDTKEFLKEDVIIKRFNQEVKDASTKNWVK